ncbi:MAG: RimK family alpha-L-glutamate ligase [Burkholderiales bacterium]
MAKRIAIITDEAGWHGTQLRRAFKARGFDSSYVSLKNCRVDFDHPLHGLGIDGFGKNLPDGVFVRGISGGSFEQVTFRLDILHTLQELGVPVYNDAGAIERSVDKARTSLRLKQAGVDTPATWVMEDLCAARTLLMRESARGNELVMKPLFGSQGSGLVRLGAGMDMPDSPEYNQLYYFQRYIDSGEGKWHDWRVLIVGDQVQAAMVRRGTSWINNVAQGARCESAVPDEEIVRLARKAVRAVGMDYAGVDIMRDVSGKAYVIEVNSIPAWRGLQSVTTPGIAQILVDDFIARKIPSNLEAVG